MTKINALILITTIALGFGLTLWLKTAPAPAPAPVTRAPAASENATLPAFSFATLEGEQHSAADFAGKWLLINFWASWCAPCIAEFPMLLELADTYPDRLVLLAISSDQTVEAIDRFKTKLAEKDRALLNLPNVKLIHDENSALTFDLFQTMRLPETIIVSPQQKMIKKLVGVDWHAGDVRALIEQSP